MANVEAVNVLVAWSPSPAEVQTRALALPAGSTLEDALRAAGCEVEDMEISKADLEDVFVQIMRREGEMPGSTPNTAMEAAA